MESTSPMETVNWLSMLWAFINSPVGLTLIGSVLALIIGKVFTAKPAWKAAVIKYGPVLMSAIKKAEKAIPDGTANKSMARLDAALKYAIELEPKLVGINSADVKAALTAVHTQAEANENI